MLAPRIEVCHRYTNLLSFYHIEVSVITCCLCTFYSLCTFYWFNTALVKKPTHIYIEAWLWKLLQAYSLVCDSICLFCVQDLVECMPASKPCNIKMSIFLIICNNMYLIYYVLYEPSRGMCAVTRTGNRAWVGGGGLIWVGCLCEWSLVTFFLQYLFIIFPLFPSFLNSIGWDLRHPPTGAAGCWSGLLAPESPGCINVCHGRGWWLHYSRHTHTSVSRVVSILWKVD